MDNQHNNPIVPEREDGLGQGSNGSQSEPYKSRETLKNSDNLSSVWKLVAALALLGMLFVSWFGWQQYQQFVGLQQRFQVLDFRLFISGFDFKFRLPNWTSGLEFKFIYRVLDCIC